LLSLFKATKIALNMIRKGQKLYSILHKRCPRCHEGKFFKYKVSFKLFKINELYKTCSKCGQKYYLEPSFYYGAMYVSYGLTVALAVAVFVISYLIGLSPLYILIAITASLLLGSPFVLQLSRIIWINLFVSYDKNALKKND
jgi:uncharacterized protein (DUF983 family)